jgi:cation:H+ antiporter
MVMPNGILAFYYAWKKKPEVVYTSQVGDGHICIPLCIGIAALFRPVPLPAFFVLGVGLLAASTLVHVFCVAFLGRLPRLVGALLCLGYGLFIYRGLQP